jgi:hypothetical protein
MRMMVRVPSAAAFPEEYCPKQSQQCNQSYRAEDNKPSAGGGIPKPPRGQYLVGFRIGQEKWNGPHGRGPLPLERVVSSSVSVPAAIFKRCIR